MSKYLDELNSVIEQYEADAHLGTFSKNLHALSSLIEIEAIKDEESSIAAGDYEDSIVSDFLNKSDDMVFTGTGFRSFDRVTGGFERGEFLIIAGLHGMGKTVLMIEIANHWASKGKADGFLSLEASGKNITKKFLANLGRLSPAFFNKEWGSAGSTLKLSNAAAILKANPIYIYQNPNLHLNKLIIQIRKLVIERKVQIVFIDYLELIIIGGFNNNLDSKRTIICNKFKQLAIELEIVLIMSSKLHRDSYRSINKSTPEYCDFVSKGLIEPNTDTVIVHRPEYFGIEVDENNQPTKNRVELILAKYSTGQFCEVPLKAALDKTAIMEISYD